jgi:hypothetical protein
VTELAHPQVLEQLRTASWSRTMTRLATFAAVLLAVGIPSGQLAAQQPPTSPPDTGVAVRVARTPDNAYRFRLLGVYDATSGEPIAGVEVSDILTGIRATTTATGTVSLYFLPEGGSFVRLRKVGYGVETVPVSISPADTTPVTLTLTRATQLETVVVHGDSTPHYLSRGLRGFAERASHHLGHFIGESDLRKNDSRQLGTMLGSHLPGVMVMTSRSSSYLVSTRKMCKGPVLSGCQRPNCFVSVYLDGALIYPGGPLPDFSRMFVDDYAAVEFYETSEAPPEFSDPGNDCGALVLWSRER